MCIKHADQCSLLQNTRNTVRKKIVAVCIKHINHMHLHSPTRLTPTYSMAYIYDREKSFFVATEIECKPP